MAPCHRSKAVDFRSPAFQLSAFTGWIDKIRNALQERRFYNKWRCSKRTLVFNLFAAFASWSDWFKALAADALQRFDARHSFQGLSVVWTKKQDSASYQSSSQRCVGIKQTTQVVTMLTRKFQPEQCRECAQLIWFKVLKFILHFGYNCESKFLFVRLHSPICRRNWIYSASKSEPAFHRSSISRLECKSLCTVSK